MRYQEAIKALKHGHESKFVLEGDEPYLKDQFIRASEAYNKDSEKSVFYPESEESALDTLYTEGFFGKRVVVLMDFNRMTVEKFGDVLGQSGDVIVMCLTDGAKSSTRVMGPVMEKSCKVDCKKMREYGSDYPNWISSKARAAGYTLQDEADSAIYNKTGPEMFAISQELKKLFILKSDEKIISVDDVNDSVSDTAAESSYEILGCLLKRNVVGALSRLDRYVRTTDNLFELSMFLFHYMEKMYRIILMREMKMDPADIASVLRIPKFYLVSRYMPRALSLGKSEIARQLSSLADLDVQLRSFKGDRKVLLERFIYGFVQ